MKKTNSMRVNEKFLDVMDSLSLPHGHFSILLAFSGGADSSALLALLDKYARKYGYALHALHVNHMIRAGEADRDAEFCCRVCKAMGIPFLLNTFDVPGIARESKCGIEEAARNVRYEALMSAASKISGDTGADTLIATAHNADDNTETVLFNLVRGSALTGLCGIDTQRDNIIRPLISSTKEEIFDYCEENGIEYITDSTNTDTAYTRNKLRHKVIPVLREINPSLTRAISRSCASLKADEDCLWSMAEAFLSEYCHNRQIPLCSLTPLHKAIRSRVIYRFLSENGVGDLGEVHVSSVNRLCDVARAHSAIELPGKYIAAIEQGHLCIKKRESSANSAKAEFDFDFLYGINRIDSTGDIIARFDASDRDNIEKIKNVYKKSIQTQIASAKIEGALRVRSRRAGDTFMLNGVNRKLKKLLWELIPEVSMRNTLPLVCDEDGILWVPGTHSRTGSFGSENENTQIFFYVKNQDTDRKDSQDEK